MDCNCSYVLTSDVIECLDETPLAVISPSGDVSATFEQTIPASTAQREILLMEWQDSHLNIQLLSGFTQAKACQ